MDSIWGIAQVMRFLLMKFGIIKEMDLLAIILTIVYIQKTSRYSHKVSKSNNQKDRYNLNIFLIFFVKYYEIKLIVKRG